jgi:glycosyltransferase involved in cell wall biosynthesis
MERCDMANRPDGLTITFISPCRYGSVGETKTISYSTAEQLVIRGYAKLSIDDTSAVVQAVAPPAPPAAPYAFKATAICPTFNRRSYLPTSIGLFLNQTMTNSELLIVDDSYESVADLVPDHPRIRYVRLARSERKELIGHDGRMLIGAKRNVCCELAKGEFIIHWDDDDWQGPARIADQVAQLEKFNKQVLTYCNILYWNDAGRFACRCFPRKELHALHGATFCYRKAWWEKHKFEPLGGGEDTRFGTVALANKELLITDAQQHIVVRAHGNDDKATLNRGNTCDTARHMGTPSIPKVDRDEIPAEFFEPLAKEDVVIGVIKNYDWKKIGPYVVSLARSGFCGVKLMLVENIAPDARAGLVKHGFTVIDFATPPQVLREERLDYLCFGRHRFKYAIDYLKRFPGRFGNVVWCDVRDQIFQSDPSAWLKKNLNPPYKIVAAGEGWYVKDEKYNDDWTKTVSPDDYDWLRELEICCSGTFAGEAEAMLGIFERIYEMTLASIDVRPNNADQAMFNRIIRTSPYKKIVRVPRMSEGFTATWTTAKTSDSRIIPNYGLPVFNAADGTVYTPEGVPFAMVHQYDRDFVWLDIMEKKYA